MLCTDNQKELSNLVLGNIKVQDKHVFFVNQKLLLPCLKCNFSKRNAVFTLLNLVKETKYVYMIATVLICFYL